MDALLAPVSLAFTVVAAGASGVFAILSWRYSRSNDRVQASREVSTLYDRCIERRFTQPDLLGRGRSWRPEFLDAIYRSSREGDEHEAWAQYYAYVELCISYCNAVLHARESRLIDEDTFRDYHERLVTLLLTENYPIIAQLAKREYLSRLVTRFLAKRDAQAWRTAHAELSSAVLSSADG